MLYSFHKLKQQAYLQVFTIYLRYLIGGAFIIAAFGMGKVNGEANLLYSLDTPIEKLEPIQQFFRVMVDSGLYWHFIGWTQIIAGTLLMTQRFSRLGALIFFGMILNIFIITVAYDFTGTPVITGLMLLASIYLLIWDLPSFIPLLRNRFNYQPVTLRIADSLFWVILGVIMLVSIIMLALFHQNIFLQLIIIFLEGLAGFILFFVLNKKRNIKTNRN